MSCGRAGSMSPRPSPSPDHAQGAPISTPWHPRDFSKRPIDASAPAASGLRSSRAAVVEQPPLVAMQQPEQLRQRPRTVAGSSSAASSPDRASDADAAGPASKRPQQPLLHDVSLYSNPHVAPDSDSTSLEELAHVVRLSKYQERKCANTRVRLQRNLVSTALSARLARCGDMAYRSLAESFRGDTRNSFVKLYNAVQDVRKSCDEFRKFALLEPDADHLLSHGIAPSDNPDGPSGPLPAAGATATSVVPFLHEISAEARNRFISFLRQIRNNPDYLATRLCTLTGPELAAVTSFHQGMEPIDTVLPFHNLKPSRSSAARAAANDPGSLERLLSFQRHDPLSALLHTCFANSAGPDSAEDQRRTEVWATVCARLIMENRADAFLVPVLNAWTAMRGWSGRSNMEWYLMKILEDGAFLLERAEDQRGTRFNIADWTAKDSIAAAEFIEKATADLFEIIDDEDATGIPEGLLELGNQILKKLDSRYVDGTRSWFVYKWLFSVWLIGVVVHPESHGLMAEYHITEYGRQTILKAVAQRAQKYVVDMTAPSSNMSRPVSTPPKVKAHVENILNRLRGSKSSRASAKLLPARSITSLRETVEVHPYLVVSPSDLVTLVNTLFPERRPFSAHSGSVRSGANSISNFSVLSQPISIPMGRGSFVETASTVSTSVSSGVSEATTSREPLLDDLTAGPSSRHSPPIPDQKRGDNYEEDGYLLRLAVHSMQQSLGLDAVRGTCHPCAERWAVLFLSPDGNEMSTLMKYDPDDDVEDEENSSTSDTDEDTEDDKPELDKDYHELRDSILKLVEEYEIPQNAETEGRKTPTFSNRATKLKKYRNKNKVVTPAKTPSRNPYRRAERGTAERSRDTSRGNPDGNEPETGPDAAASEPQPVLVAMLTAASAQSRAQSDFVAAHLYWKTLQQLNTVTSDSLRRNGFATLLNIFSRGPRDSVHRSSSAIEEYDAWMVWLKQSQERAEGLIERMMKRLRALRDKMWYVSDVRSSAPFDDSRLLALALQTMGSSRKWDSYQRARQTHSRNHPTSYLFRSETQTVKLIAAREEQGGPNKLTDDVVDRTKRWLNQSGIANFCQGEERIHLFCCEITTCIGRLIGENINDAPVLWSTELYSREKRRFEGSRSSRDRDSYSWDDSASVVSDPDRRFSSSRPPSNTLRDLRTISAHNQSQQSLDSGRFSFSRASTVISEIGDGPDYYFTSASSVPTVDTSATYWSPFQAAMQPSSATSRAHSPTTSMTNLSGSYSHSAQQSLSRHSTGGGRPGTSASSETVYQQRVSDEKTRFLDELRQTLTSLILSDLGNLVFPRGSETDGWFADLGQASINRQEQLAATSQSAPKEKQPRSSNRHHPAKQRDKRTFGDLRDVKAEPASSASSAADNNPTPDTPGSRGNDSSTATSDTSTAHSMSSRRRTDLTPEFPFTKAYQRLLRMFCVHPNPYVKLNALFELEHLIVASLTSGGSSTRRKLAWTTRAELARARPSQALVVVRPSFAPGRSTRPSAACRSAGRRQPPPWCSHHWPHRWHRPPPSWASRPAGPSAAAAATPRRGPSCPWPPCPRRPLAMPSLRCYSRCSATPPSGLRRCSGTCSSSPPS